RQETLTFKHSGEVRCVAFSPDASDGLRIASGASDEGLVKVWDAQTDRVSVEFRDHFNRSGRKVVIFCLAWHPKGHRIASAGGRDTVRVWDARTEREVFPLPPAPLNYIAVAFSPNSGRYLVTGNTDGAVQVWDGETGQPVGMLGTHTREVVGLVFS